MHLPLSTALRTMLALWLMASASAQVLISEFLASNSNGLRDADGDTSDWVELYNSGTQPVNLSGWSLTDDRTQPLQWTFPSTPLPAGGYLVVFASGKDRRVAGGPLHTNFRLAAAGAYLGLFAPETTVAASEFAPAYPEQRADISYGTRAGQNYYFNNPTPGTVNTGGFGDFVADTKFSHGRGFYETAFDLTISSATTNAIIRYTTNGVTPTATTGLVYTSPLRISRTTILRAAAFRAGLQPSNVDTHTYLFATDIIRQQPTGQAPTPEWPAPGSTTSINYGMDPRVVDAAAYRDRIIPALLALPSFSLVTELTNLFGAQGIYSNPGQDGRDWERPCSLEFIRTDGIPGFHARAGMRMRGGFSRSTDNPKHAFRFFFRELYGTAKLKYDLHPGTGGTDEFDALDLRTFQNYSWSFQGDPVGIFVRDQFSRDTQLALGQQGERGIYAHLYINGVYWGLFNTCERPEANYGATYFGGEPENYDVVKVEAGPYAINATDGNLSAWTRLYNRCKAGITNNAIFYALEGRLADGSPNPTGETLLDVDNLVDYQLVIFFGGNYDASVSRFLGETRPNNWYGLRDRSGTNGGFRFVAHDAEHTLKADEPSIDRTGPFSAGSDSVSYSSPHYLHQQLSANAEYRLRFADRAHRALFNGGPLTTARGLARFNARTNEIQLPVIAESARWGDSKRSTPLTLADWSTAVRNVQSQFLNSRSATLLGQLRAKNLYPGIAAPSLSQFGGPIAGGTAVTLSAPAGQIYYTLTGQDPRLPGGSTFPGATTYSGPIPISESLTIKARTKVGSDWSALVEADFSVIQTFQDLVVTEIMYRPAAVPGVDRDDLEFVELKNTGTTELDLSGVVVTNAVNFVFPRGTRLPPGKFLLLAGSTAGFTNRYPGVTPFGQYSGKLSDSGERLTLLHAVGTTAFEVRYDNQAPWPTSADGGGFSLVPRNPGSGADPNLAATWRASTLTGGSPGSEDPASNITPVVLNEILTHTDLPKLDTVELHNPNRIAADVSGWFLSDDRSRPRKYRFPTGSTVPPGGYLLVDEDQFNAPALGTNAFRLSSIGETLLLSSADASGELTGYSDVASLGAAPNGFSFGRHTNSTGDVGFPVQKSTSLGAINSGPLVGPVVFNEILAAPSPGDVPFLEIINIASTNVAMFDPLFPSNRWRIEGVGFEFPGGLSLRPGEIAVVAGGDPAAFRNRHGIPGGVLVLGPFPGLLQPNGERLELQRPDSPNEILGDNGQATGYVVPYVNVDTVRYDDRAPWPTNGVGALSGGASLERQIPVVYGNDPVAWKASTQRPSPGADNAGNRPPVALAGSDQELVQAAFPAVVQLTGSATDDGLPNGRLTYRWTQISGAPGVVFDDPDAAITTAQIPGLGTYGLRLTVGDGERTSSSALTVTASRPGSEVTVSPLGASWRYFDQRVDLGTAWQAANFVETADWKTGRARLGYGGDGEVTVINGGPTSDRIPTAYFRRKFTVADPAAFTALTLQLIRDDGAIVYLNGTEVFRSNLPEGDAGFLTFASNVTGNADEVSPFSQTVSPALLRTGENTLAVEVHQANAGSSDLGLDLALLGVALGANARPTANAGVDRTVVLPATARLRGVFADDGLPASPGVPIFGWSKVSGPGSVSFEPANVPNPTASFGAPGRYELRFSVDDSALSASDTVFIEVDAGTPSLLLTLSHAGADGTQELTFSAAAGQSYVLQRRSSLNGPDWTLLKSIPAGPTQTIRTVITPNEAEQFFRVITP